MVTLQHIINEVQRIRRNAGMKYEKLVTLRKMTTYERDSKLAVWDELLKNCFDAKEKNIPLTHQLKQMP